MFDFNVLEAKDSDVVDTKDSACSSDSTTSTTCSSTASSEPLTAGSVAAEEESDSETDAVEVVVSRDEYKFWFFDFDDLEEVEAAKSTKAGQSLMLEEMSDEPEPPVVCSTPGSAAAQVVAQTFALADYDSPTKAEALQLVDLLPQQVPRKKIFFLFDWDDTLCPTSWIENRPDLKRSALEKPAEKRERSGEEWQRLSEHARAVAELVRAAQSLGQVALVTLAQRAWVSISIKEFMPEVKDELCKLEVFYARENPLPQYTGCPWTAMKKRAMQQALTRLGESRWDSFVSIGDSEIERRAAQDLGRELQSRGSLKWTKTVKFCERPNVLQLTSQVRFLSKVLKELTESSGHRHIDSKDWFETD
jgi:hypothetical protein